MKNIILLPLDERPCNFDFPSKIFNGEKYTIIRPEHLGQKKTPASYEFIRDFLLANIEKADAAVISIDTLLYGGLIPSRLHHLSEETVLERLMLLKELREKNPQVKLYAFQCIMRCPKYSSDDELIQCVVVVITIDMPTPFIGLVDLGKRRRGNLLVRIAPTRDSICDIAGAGENVVEPGLFYTVGKFAAEKFGTERRRGRV